MAVPFWCWIRPPAVMPEAIYPRLGWQRVGVIPDYALFPDGRYCGTTLFYKRIG